MENGFEFRHLGEPALYDCGSTSGIRWSGWLKRYVTVILVECRRNDQE